MKLRDLLARLKATYTGSIGAEFMHISEVEQRQWIYKKLEAAGGNYQLDADTQRRTLERLTAAEGLERYLHTKYVGQALLAGRRRFADPDDGHHHPQRRQGWRQDVVIGMAHRGRLNVLVNTLGRTRASCSTSSKASSSTTSTPRPAT